MWFLFTLCVKGCFAPEPVLSVISPLVFSSTYSRRKLLEISGRGFCKPGVLPVKMPEETWNTDSTIGLLYLCLIVHWTTDGRALHPLFRLSDNSNIVFLSHFHFINMIDIGFCNKCFLLVIILERIRVKTETEIADEQVGFRQGRGTRDQITNLRILMHKAREHQQPLCMWFVDFKKAFDSISHDKLWVTMMDMGYPLHLIDLLAKLYKKQLTKVKVAGTLSEWFRVKKGVRQGCVLSPY